MLNSIVLIKLYFQDKLYFRTVQVLFIDVRVGKSDGFQPDGQKPVFHFPPPPPPPLTCQTTPSHWSLEVTTALAHTTAPRHSRRCNIDLLFYLDITRARTGAGA